MHKAFHTYWNQLKRRFNLLRIASIVLPFVAAVLLVLAIANYTHLSIPFEFWVVFSISIIGLLLIWNSKLHWGNQELLDFLHQKYPELEYSLSIFFNTNPNPVQNLQQNQIIKKLPRVNSIAFPFAWKGVFIVLIISVLCYSVSFFSPIQEPSENLTIQKEIPSIITEDSISKKKIESFEYGLTIYPPNYTKLKSFVWKKDLKVPQGSRIVFSNKGTLDFDLIWQNQKNYPLAKDESKRFTLYKSSMFQLQYQQNDSAVFLTPEVLEVLRDAPPVLSTNLKENRHEIEWEELNKDFSLDLTIEDDYGIVSADIIMTLSRGEGESVRFREMKQSIRSVSQKLRRQNIAISLPLDTFALEPGDELYFYFSAKDNQEPVGNTSKTDVYFLSIADTVESEPVSYEGFALTNEAEYFKSQRQIIIDTEQLLEDQSQITPKEFEDRSNVIGADQKLLRLRYGVFLGEEYETTGGLGDVDHSGHDHADESAENDSHEDHEHESEGNFSNPIFNETPELEAYVHAHGDSELSTFLDAEVKAKLKEALTNMWEAELFLRTYKPKKALPYEYRALELIKEVKRASRIYVERMGFEPPPIDEQKKRLTGELDKIKAKASTNDLGEQSFGKKLLEAYTQLMLSYQKNDLEGAELIIDEFTDALVLKITSEPVRYGKALASVKQFQSRKSTETLRLILKMMADMLTIDDLEKGNLNQSSQTSLHKTYYELQND